MKKQKKDNKESIYRIDYDKTVIFKERVTRFTVRFEFKGKEKEKIINKYFLFRLVSFGNGVRG